MAHTAPEKFLARLLEEWPELRGRLTLKPGCKHEKLLLDGRMVQVLTRSRNEDRRSEQNARAAVRRALQAC